MPGENIEVVPSEENGNVPAEAAAPITPSAPSEPVVDTPAVPAEPIVEPATPAVPTEPELFELPDGRKVDAATLATEFKENFLPEFTRKSQRLAELEKPPTDPQPPKSPYADPEYVPQSYEEIIKAAEERALQTLEQREADRIARDQALETAVANQLSEVKKLDPTVNENQLFLHANKYGFRDLTAAYQNMKDMNAIVKTVQKQTAENIQKRQDPVSVSPGAIGTTSDPSAFATARDYLRSLKT